MWIEVVIGIAVVVIMVIRGRGPISFTFERQEETMTIAETVSRNVDKGIADALQRLQLPDLAQVNITGKPKVKLTSYTRVREFTFSDGHGRAYYESVLKTSNTTHGKRRKIAIQTIIEQLKGKTVSSQFADKIIRILLGKKLPKHHKWKYTFCNAIPLDFQNVTDDGKHFAQSAVVAWIIDTHNENHLTLNFNQEELDRLGVLRREEFSYWEECIDIAERRAAMRANR